MLKKMTFVIFKQMKIEYNWCYLPVGTNIEVKNFDGKEIKFKVVKNDPNLQTCANMCLKSNLNNTKKDLKKLKDALELWKKEPDKFVCLDKLRNHWLHKEGKKCKYSYLASLGYFLSKEEFENMVKEREIDIEMMSTGKKDKYYYDLVASHDYEFSVEDFNKHIMIK